MSIASIQSRLLTYDPQTVVEQEHALKEIAQEIALLALSRAGFFRVAEFQGGTCLRILYGLERFSEDLDFVLEKSNKNFAWREYIEYMQEEFKAYGFTLEIKDRAKAEQVVKTAFLKADSKGGVLILKDSRNQKPQLRIKLEIDTNPPQGATSEIKYLDFPISYSIRTQDLSSLFAGKCHALLCRSYLKGRDWFDFNWYVARKIEINFKLLSNAIAQAGPWKNQNINVDAKWLAHELKMKINAIDWSAAKQDAARFLRNRELATLDLWSKEFFLSRVERLQ
ncbi:MAG: nucleotidyl transferase AbiEii/AbiGii toxin family protein [Bdellovibrionota bacterium]